MPRWRRPRATCWSRSSASFPLPSRRRASTRVSRASRPTTDGARRHPRRPAQDAGRRRWDEAAAAAILAPARRGRFRHAAARPRLPAGHRSRASTASPPTARSRSRRAGERSRRSCSRDSSQFRPGPPYAVTSRKYAADLNEVKALGGDGVTTPSARTPEQTEIALFWVESSPLQWNRIATNRRRRDAGSICGSRRGCSPCSTWPWPTATSAPSTPSTTTTTGGRSPRSSSADTDGNPNTSADPTLDAAGDDASDPGLRLGTRGRGWRRCRGPEAVLRHRPHRLRDLQPDAAGRADMHRRVAGPAPLRQLLPGGGGERGLAHPRRVPLPQGGGRGDRTRRQDRRPGGQAGSCCPCAERIASVERGPVDRGLARGRERQWRRTSVLPPAEGGRPTSAPDALTPPSPSRPSLDAAVCAAQRDKR